MLVNLIMGLDFGVANQFHNLLNVCISDSVLFLCFTDNFLTSRFC
jgi:hypothetical protein